MMLVWRMLCYIWGRSVNLSWHSMMLLMKHWCVRVLWLLFTEIWIHCHWNRILRMCGLLNYWVSGVIIIHDILCISWNIWSFLACLSKSSLSNCISSIVGSFFNASQKSFMVSWILEIRYSEIGCFLFLLGFSWIGTKEPLRFLFVLVSSVELPEEIHL